MANREEVKRKGKVLRTVGVVTGAIALAAVIAAFGAWLNSDGALNLLFQKENPVMAIEPPPPMHGGSLAAFAYGGQQWAVLPGHPNIYSSKLAHVPKALLLEGINADTNGKSYDLENASIKNITSNWTITLDYRDKYGDEDQNSKLQICTRLNDSFVCDPKPELTSLTSDNPSMTIYLVGKLDKNLKTKTTYTTDPFSHDPDKDYVESDPYRYGLHYDVDCEAGASTPTTAPGSAKDEHSYRNRCNHIFNVQLSALVTSHHWWCPWQPRNKPPVTYHCVDGACEFVINGTE